MRGTVVELPFRLGRAQILFISNVQVTSIELSVNIRDYIEISPLIEFSVR